MTLLSNILNSGILPAIQLLLIAVVPMLFFAWVIHLCEKLIQYRLARRFGWNSVMITGWIGTPVHELSHALMCAVFQHDIVEMELFKPDKKNGRLGYVTHTWQRGNFYQEVGTFFIGIAPLFGGATLLLTLLMVFFPDVGREALFSEVSDLPLWQQVGESLRALTTGLFHPTNLFSIRLWLFLYLVTCIGSHMAPSTSDYEGGVKGGLLVAIILIVGSLLLALLGPETGTILSFAKPALIPVITLMISVIALCASATAVVFLGTEAWDRIQGIG